MSAKQVNKNGKMSTKLGIAEVKAYTLLFTPEDEEESITDEAVKSMITSMDTDKDGYVVFAEFQDFVLTMIAEWFSQVSICVYI